MIKETAKRFTVWQVCSFKISENYNFKSKLLQIFLAGILFKKYYYIDEFVQRNFGDISESFRGRK